MDPWYGFLPGQTGQAGVFTEGVCTGGTMNVTQAVSSWWTGNSGVGTVSGSGLEYAVAAGETSVSSVLYYTGPMPEAGNCECGEREAFPESGMTVEPGCGDDRDNIIAEYPQHNVNFTPACTDFTNNASTQNFSFSELNTGDHSWAILRSYFLANLENTRTNYGNQSMNVNSAYRCPVRNSNIPGAAVNSRHMYGDAADIASNANSWSTLRQAAKDAGACVQPQAASGTGKVHMDWRGACPTGW